MGPLLASFGLFLFVTLAIRAAIIGQPILNTDEQFYLLVGDRMLAGALPYVDIWDRKPPVLFAIYAAIRALGGNGVWQMHAVSIACTAATALIIQRIALRIAPPTGAMLSGIAYCLWTALCGGALGQAGVFFNLFMVCAAWLLLPLLNTRPTAGSLALRGWSAMLLAGLAIQTKQTVVFEAAFFGFTLAIVAWRNARPPAASAIIVAGAFFAAMPSLAIVAFWWSKGALDALLFATVTSAGLREGMGAADYVWHLATSLLMAAPLLAFAVAGIRTGRIRPWREDAVRLFLAAWLAVAFVALLAYDRTFYDHYLLGPLVPACICAAPAFGQVRRYRGQIGATALALLIAIGALQWDERRQTGGWTTLAALYAATQGQRNCPFSLGGPAVAYVVNRWCLPTRFGFTGHLTYAAEAPAIGADPIAEVRRILDMRPDRIVIKSGVIPKGNAATRALVDARLARDYRRIARIEPDGLAVYALRDGLIALPNAVSYPR